MQYIQGISRHQLQMSSLEDKIAADNSVRFIDAFVGFIDLQKIGFEPRTLKKEGRPSYQTEVFLKIYLYGYLNGVRSSRKLEKECIRNIEMQWLLEDIRPNYHSIADFRKENPKALEVMQDAIDVNEFKAMMERGKNALADEDCEMCGS